MMRAKCVAAAALLFTSLNALAVDTTYDFDSVTKISYTSASTTDLTGVLVNDTAPTTVTLPSISEGMFSRCADLWNDMRRYPGMYVLSVTIRVTVNPPPINTTVTTVSNCSLELKP